MNLLERDRLIERFQLLPHPEGGFFRETYRATQRVSNTEAPDGTKVPRDYAASTAIYYLLSEAAFSAWHRIRADEVWHFYAGDALDVHVIEADGRLTTHRLGNGFGENEPSDEVNHPQTVFQAVVRAGHWFAAQRVPGKHGYAFVGCTVAPGFEFSEFELATPSTVAELTSSCPAHADLIRALAPA
jgi:predicted cupin superfamily sugar epimerase